MLTWLPRWKGSWLWWQGRAGGRGGGWGGAGEWKGDFILFTVSVEFICVVGSFAAMHDQHDMMIGLSDARHHLLRDYRHWATIWEFEVMEVGSKITLRELELKPLCELVSYWLDRMIGYNAIEGKD